MPKNMGRLIRLLNQVTSYKHRRKEIQKRNPTGNDPELFPRLYSGWEIGQRRNELTNEHLKKILSGLTHRNWKIRHSHINALAEIGNEKHLPIFINEAKDTKQNRYVRMISINKGLYKFRDNKEVVDTLILLLGDKDYNILEAAYFVLAKSNNETAKLFTNGFSYGVANATLFLKHIDKIILLARSDDYHIQSRANNILNQLNEFGIDLKTRIRIAFERATDNRNIRRKNPGKKIRRT